MMKKNGFTLAEVLITLAIIGVVATLTLPALMTNVGEQQYKTALKKALNTLSEAGQMSQAMDGFDYSSLTTNVTNADEQNGSPIQSLYSLLHRRTNMAELADGANHRIVESNYSGNNVVYFRDGTSLIFSMNDTIAGNNEANAHRIRAIIDVNGKKGPNLMSNCGGAKTASNTYSPARDNCNTRSQRVIKDQFAVYLENGLAKPNSPVAEWAATD